MAKKITANYYCVNVKIRSTPKPVPTDYSKLIIAVFAKDSYIRYGSDKAVAFKNQFTSKLSYKDREYQFIYGKIVKFTIVEGSHWYSRGSKDYIDVEIPEDTYPNAIESDYIFIPAIHRFLLKKGRLGVKIVEKFLETSFNEVAKDGQIVEAIFQKSIDSIDKIFSSSLLSLDVELSYTNDDISEDAKELIDDLLKKGDIGKFSAQLRPDSDNGLDTKSPLVAGLIELSKDNGNLKASVVDAYGKHEKIVTEDYPETVTITSETINDVNKDAVTHFLKRYPRPDGQN